MGNIAEWIFQLNGHGAEAANPYDRLLVPEGDPRSQWLEYYFKNSLKPHRWSYGSEDWCPAAEIRIVKIWEVMNDSTNQAYLRELKEMQQSRDSNRTKVAELENAIRVRTEFDKPKLNEALLFHGCKWQSVFAILKEGF